MAPHSSTLAWKIRWTEEPGGLLSMGLHRVGHDWATSLSRWLFTFMHWRRKWQPTPVFLPGESQGRGSLVGCRLWGRTVSDTTEATWQQQPTWKHCVFVGRECLRNYGSLLLTRSKLDLPGLICVWQVTHDTVLSRYTFVWPQRESIEGIHKTMIPLGRGKFAFIFILFLTVWLISISKHCSLVWNDK